MHSCSVQTLMSVQWGAMSVPSLRAVSTSKEDIAVCLLNALQTTSKQRRGESWWMASWLCRAFEMTGLIIFSCFLLVFVVRIKHPSRCYSPLFSCLSSPLLPAIPALYPMNLSCFTCSRCERVTCEFTRDPASCFMLPQRMSFYNTTFPTNTPVPADVFRMGPSNSVPGDKMLLNIVSGDEEGYFSVQQHAYGGVISLSRDLSNPRDFFLTVEMRLIRYGTSHLYMAKIAVFITHWLPILADS